MGKKSFKIVTLGCKVNQYESAQMREALLNEGWVESGEQEQTDLTVVNTCIVTQRASYQSRQAVRKAIRSNPSGRTAAVGCYAQVYRDDLAKIKGLDLIVDNRSKGRLSMLLKGHKGPGPLLDWEGIPPEDRLDGHPIRSFLDRTRAFLKVQDGCQSFCTYCIVPLARGPLRSLAPSQVLASLRCLADEGYREVVLTGIHLGKYGEDLSDGPDLKGLLDCIGSEALPLRIRLSSIEPNEISEGLVDKMASEDWLCRHFHIPLQSGDDGILKRMKRPYRARDFKKLVELIHKRMPLAAIGVDTMVGFPGEDGRAFGQTHALIEELPVSYLHVFPYSPREGTPAAGFPDQVESKIAKERASRLRRLGLEKRKAFYQSCLGKSFDLLAQGWASEEKEMIKGLSDNYLPIQFPSTAPMSNVMTSVRVERVKGEEVFGRME